MRGKLFACAAALLLLLTAGTAGAATITIVNVDGPGEGFNDPTPATPVGGNPGTTLGQQRLLAFQDAADVWAQTLDSPVEIRIQASIDPLFCTAGSATLGAAGTIQVARDFPGAPLAGTWYHIALANKLAGVDLIPGAPGTGADDIQAFFNSDIDNNPNCLAGTNWYYGLDHNEGTDIDFKAVVLHELNHGLGFANFVDETTGALLAGFPGVYSHFTLDTNLGLYWDQMTNAQRQASAISCDAVVWDGPNVNTFAPFVLDQGTPILDVQAPNSIAGAYRVGTASFGPAISSPGVTGSVELVDDATGTVTDGCEPLVGFTAGNIALIDRGSCAFTVKVQNAEAAGATAAIIADNVAGCPPVGLGGAGTTNIPAARITLDLGNDIKTALGGGTVTANLGVDASRLAGANSAGMVQLYAADPVAPGSSISHWDTLASPDLLMEPFSTPGLTSDLDLSPAQAADIGWMFLQTCGNNLREGVELCDGTDLNGQTCVSLGFDGGALGCDNTCTAFDTTACYLCDNGRTWGKWNQPAGTQLGHFSGGLYINSTTALYKIVGSILPTAPGQGVITGIIYDGVAPEPDYYVHGDWSTTGPNQGKFSSKIFEFGTGNTVGYFEGNWRDNPSFAIVGQFGGAWEICN